jgi:hypothetical protein
MENIVEHFMHQVAVYNKNVNVDFNTLSDSEKMVYTINDMVDSRQNDPDPDVLPIPKVVADGVINSFNQSGLSYAQFMENIFEHFAPHVTQYNKNLDVESCVPFLRQSGMNKEQIEDIRTRYQRSDLSTWKEFITTEEEFITTEWVKGLPMCEQLERKYRDESLGDEERLEAFCLKFSLNDDRNNEERAIVMTHDEIQQTKNSYYGSGLSFSEYLHNLSTSDDMYECLCGSGLATRECPCNM